MHAHKGTQTAQTRQKPHFTHTTSEWSVIFQCPYWLTTCLGEHTHTCTHRDTNRTNQATPHFTHTTSASEWSVIFQLPRIGLRLTCALSMPYIADVLPIITALILVRRHALAVPLVLQETEPATHNTHTGRVMPFLTHFTHMLPHKHATETEPAKYNTQSCHAIPHSLHTHAQVALPRTHAQVRATTQSMSYLTLNAHKHADNLATHTDTHLLPLPDVCRLVCPGATAVSILLVILEAPLVDNLASPAHDTRGGEQCQP